MSGVGKTTVIESIRFHHPEFRHVIAGELIRRGTERTGTDAYIRPKVQDANHAAFFQEILIQEFQREIEQSKEALILDGHFVVPTVAGPSPVPSYVFRRLGIQQLFLLLGDPNELAIRLMQRPVRAPWWDGSVESLSRFQLLEEQHANAVASETGIPLSASHVPELIKAAILSALKKPI
jgi:adenylate kinase